MPEVANTNGLRGISFGVKAVLVTLVPVAGLGVFKLLFWLITNPRVFLYIWGIALAIGLLSEHYIREWRNNSGSNDSGNRTVIVTAITEEPNNGSIANENPAHPAADSMVIPNNSSKHQKKLEIPFPPEEEAFTPLQKVSTKVITLIKTGKTDDKILPNDLSQATARTLDLESLKKPMITDDGDNEKSKKGNIKMDVNKNYMRETEWGSISSPPSEMNIIFSGMSKLKEDESTYAMKS